MSSWSARAALGGWLSGTLACGAFAASGPDPAALLRSLGQGRQPIVSVGDAGADARAALSFKDGVATLTEWTGRDDPPREEQGQTVRSWTRFHRAFDARLDGALETVETSEEGFWHGVEEMGPGRERDQKAGQLIRIGEGAYGVASLEELIAKASAGGLSEPRKMPVSPSRSLVFSLQPAGRYFSESLPPPGAERATALTILETETLDVGDGRKQVLFETSALLFLPDGSAYSLRHELVKKQVYQSRRPPDDDDRRSFADLLARYAARALP